MDLLKREDGFTIIESLVSIVLLGLIAGMSIMVISRIYTNPKMLIKGEAGMIASQEIDYSLKNKVVLDTAYPALGNKLEVKRSVTVADALYHIEVKLTYKGTHEEILKLGVYDYR